MAQVEESGSGRSANTDLNLVPFIDLMSVLITFLLITAVWTQVSMIQLGSSIYANQTNENPAPPPPMADIPLRVDVKDFGFRVIIGAEIIRVPKSQEGYDIAGLLDELKKIKDKYPAKVDGVVTVDDEIVYENLILAMDAMLRAGFAAVSVATGGSE